MFTYVWLVQKAVWKSNRQIRKDLKFDKRGCVNFYVETPAIGAIQRLGPPIPPPLSSCKNLSAV